MEGGAKKVKRARVKLEGEERKYPSLFLHLQDGREREKQWNDKQRKLRNPQPTHTHIYIEIQLCH